ncbi:hypothetical protein MLD38_025213 [Melastoma candidum]|uniref:Uncharacterized protein n=1 Tax=Melastoma candidum TaxID=119954 RepID=A0ACB9NXR6_9MYRT|nr:hypothetical protein MLD38_025213 [Melastoma candidum]
MTIANNIKTSIPHNESAREYLMFVEERFRSADKSLAGTLMVEFATMKYDGSRSMQQHAIEMTNIAANLKTLGMTVEDLLGAVHHELASLLIWTISNQLQHNKG